MPVLSQLTDGLGSRCLDSKKECISRTGPRTRRRRKLYAHVAPRTA